jgi:hypothetical protein
VTYLAFSSTGTSGILLTSTFEPQGVFPWVIAGFIRRRKKERVNKIVEIDDSIISLLS